MADVLIALGANLGDRAHTLAGAVEHFRAHPKINRLRASAFRETVPIGGPGGQPAFLNAAARFSTDLPPEEVHALLAEIEADSGRQRAERWAARTIDLDLLLYDKLEMNSPGLLIPHPRMAFRRFVLEPAAEIAGDMLHPASDWTVARLLENLNTAHPYIAILAPSHSGQSELARQIVSACGGITLSDESPMSAADRNDSPSQVFQRQIEFLGRARAQLACDCWPAEAPLVVSDFYFDQVLACAEPLPGKLKAELEQAWASAHREVVQPNLLVVLDDLPRPSLQDVGSRASESGERLRAAMVRLARRKNLGPVLFAGRESGRQSEEAVAAVQAMR